MSRGLCLRIDLDYVPWDQALADEYGHGEPATFLRLLELARQRGVKLHVFASRRVVRAFPPALDATLGEGHHLDWLATRDDRDLKWSDVLTEFRGSKATVDGLAIPFGGDLPRDISKASFVSGGDPRVHPKSYPVFSRDLADVARTASGMRTWTQHVLDSIQGDTPLVTIALRPAALAVLDPRLAHITEIIDRATESSREIVTLREWTARPEVPSRSPTPEA